jgi:hypothetical protein
MVKRMMVSAVLFHIDKESTFFACEYSYDQAGRVTGNRMLWSPMQEVSAAPPIKPSPEVLPPFCPRTNRVHTISKKSPAATKPLTPRLAKNPTTCQLH